ncbi:hypothetical protein [Terrabacter sp. Ter38]|uniref:hypothetical protein n=1 Tax=Terrabacter sp. Ter38 TaxID=2926030 RepID=UPI002740C1C3|nr:hypothetical protein [Terrabacter sp. Ter38]
MQLPEQTRLINSSGEPGKILVPHDGIAGLRRTTLTADDVRDLVERMLKSSGRRVYLSSPFVEAPLPDGSRWHVVISHIRLAHWPVNIRRFVVTRTISRTSCVSAR